MKKFLMSLAAVSALFVAPSLAEAAVRGVATANVNMRSGPSTAYPAVVVIPVGAPLTINGCMSTVNWCDVSFAGGRGWVSGNYIQASYRSNRVYIEPDYYRGLGIPSVTFDVNTYWGRYYRDRDFYRERDRWRRYDWRSERPLPPPPPPPRWDDRRPPPPRWDDRGPPPRFDDRDRLPPRFDDRGPPRRFDDRDGDRDRAPPRFDPPRRDDRGPPPPPREERRGPITPHLNQPTGPCGTNGPALPGCPSLPNPG